jgi:hypothetical protein
MGDAPQVRREVRQWGQQEDEAERLQALPQHLAPGKTQICSKNARENQVRQRTDPATLQNFQSGWVIEIVQCTMYIVHNIVL